MDSSSVNLWGSALRIIERLFWLLSSPWFFWVCPEPVPGLQEVRRLRHTVITSNSYAMRESFSQSFHQGFDLILIHNSLGSYIYFVSRRINGVAACLLFTLWASSWPTCSPKWRDRKPLGHYNWHLESSWEESTAAVKNRYLFIVCLLKPLPHLIVTYHFFSCYELRAPLQLDLSLNWVL